MNVIAQLELELAYYDVAIQHISHYALENYMHILTICTVIIFTNPYARARYDTRSIFKRSLAGFEFSVFLLLD